MLSRSQAGFRRGMETMDQVYSLNYLVNRAIGGKMTAIFINLRAAFDSVDREILVKTMQKRRVIESLVERVEMLEKTRSRMRMGGE